MTTADRPPSVLIVGTRAPTVGGITSVIDDHVEGLTARGVSVDTYNTGARTRAYPGRFSLDNVRAAMVDAAGVWRAVRGSDPSIVAVHSVGSPLGPLVRALLLVLAARIAQRPVVLHLHAYDLEDSLRAPRFRRALRVVASMVRAVVVLYDDLVEPVRAATGARIVAIANGVDTGFFSPSDGPSHERPAASDAPAGPDDAPDDDRWPAPGPVATEAGPAADHGPHVLRVIFVGTVGRRKGVDSLVLALRSDADRWSCLIIGDAAEEARAAHDEVVRSADDLVRRGVVRFAGARSRTWIRDRLREADVFVLPSTAEGMPMALLESMACRLPVVVTDVGAMGTIVRSASAGTVVPPREPVLLADALRHLHEDPGARRHAASAARAYVTEHHDREIVLDRLLGLYGELGRGRRG